MHLPLLAHMHTSTAVACMMPRKASRFAGISERARSSTCNHAHDWVIGTIMEAGTEPAERTFVTSFDHEHGPLDLRFRTMSDYTMISMHQQPVHPEVEALPPLDRQHLHPTAAAASCCNVICLAGC